MPLVQTRGAASAQGFGEFAQATAVNYIEDVFSTFLYTGNNSTLSINNSIDLSTKGGLVWIKNRQQGSYYHTLVDTVRGPSNQIYSNATDAQYTATGLDVTAFTSTGFTLGADNFCNQNNGKNVSWTFRKQPKFFDVLTYTGTGSNTTIAHNLGSVPGSIIVKRTDTTAAWAVYHRSLANTQYLVLNSTAAVATGATWWNSTTPTSSVFSVGTDASVNASGGTYVAYVFAHDAGGFGLTGTDNVISCGSYTGTGAAGNNISLGYEPQWLLIKNSAGTYASVNSWTLYDVMRGFDNSADNILRANTSGAEIADTAHVVPTATGFTLTTSGSNTNESGATYIYIAIRRGPMKVPTVGTSVFSPQTASYSSNQVVTTGFPIDMLMMKGRTITLGTLVYDRLRGVASTNTSPVDAELFTSNTDAEGAGGYINTVNNTGYQISPGFTGFSSVNWNFGRAPSFCDVVCYTGTGANTTFTHNLGVVPELMIVKRRDTTADWDSYCSALANTEYVVLNTTAAKATGATRWNSTTPTSSVFSVGTSTTTNASAGTYVAYLFATCAGVSKVGSYTGTGTTLQINCGFTSGARFVLIKRTDSTGDWYVWDSARGIVAGNDPYLLLNSGAVEVTSTDYIDTYSAGFEISSTAPAAINASAGTFIFLAIA